jgi:hypothetical protein
LFKETNVSQLQQWVICLLFVLSLSGCGAHAPTTERLSVLQDGAHYVLSTPHSRIELLVPKDGLIPVPPNEGGLSQSRRYFLFVDPQRQLTVSGWFESSHYYPGMSQYWEQQVAAWKRAGLSEPSRVRTGRVKNWDVVFYESPESTGLSSHVRAHWIQSGTWIDIHISVMGNGPQEHAVVNDALGSLAVREKPRP